MSTANKGSKAVLPRLRRGDTSSYASTTGRAERSSSSAVSRAPLTRSLHASLPPPATRHVHTHAGEGRRRRRLNASAATRCEAATQDSGAQTPPHGDTFGGRRRQPRLSVATPPPVPAPARSDITSSVEHRGASLQKVKKSTLLYTAWSHRRNRRPLPPTRGGVNPGRLSAASSDQEVSPRPPFPTQGLRSDDGSTPTQLLPAPCCVRS